MRLVVGIVMFIVIFRLGLAMIRMFARPVPEPLPPGEMRRVNIRYRCGICGAEVRMTLATEELPAPPRHCLEDMDLVAPIDD